MSRKRIRRFAKNLEREVGLFGFDFDDITVGEKTISAEGDLAGVAETDLLINFNAKGRAKRILFSADYYDFNGRMVQDWRFSSYKRFEKAATSKKYEQYYAEANNYLGDGTERGLQRGIDMIEDIPGVKNLIYTLFNYDNGISQTWT